MISDLLGSNHPSVLWGILAVLLAIGEMVIPGTLLIWISLAAAVTAGLTWLLPIGEALQLLAFAILSTLSVYGGRKWYLTRPVEPQDPLLNDRAARMIGEQVEVVEAIAHGRGRVRVGDSVWTALGADAAAGSQVRIVGARGTELLVEQAESER